MNQIIIKKAIIFSLIFGACLGLILHIPSETLIGFTLMILLFLSSVFIILYMKKNEKHLSFIDTKEGAILGGVAGFFTTLGAFISFTPLAFIIYMFNHNSYFGSLVHSFVTETFWLYAIIAIMTSFIFAFTNASSGMGLAYVMGFFEKKPENSDAQIDIEIND